METVPWRTHTHNRLWIKWCLIEMKFVTQENMYVIVQRCWQQQGKKIEGKKSKGKLKTHFSDIKFSRLHWISFGKCERQTLWIEKHNGKIERSRSVRNAANECERNKKQTWMDGSVCVDDNFQRHWFTGIMSIIRKMGSNEHGLKRYTDPFLDGVRANEADERIKSVTENRTYT